MSRQSLSQDLTVGRIGRHVAATDGERIALDDGSRRISYRELDRRAAAPPARSGSSGSLAATWCRPTCPTASNT
ncbi:MAG: hypothetical protein M5U09_14945 [Gammaproteobacteria bacterium]|nr:hypothetical protein [Gammaproteobacteria bacterium]